MCIIIYTLGVRNNNTRRFIENVLSKYPRHNITRVVTNVVLCTENEHVEYTRFKRKHNIINGANE